jgi:hypothetical protein
MSAGLYYYNITETLTSEYNIGANNILNYKLKSVVCFRFNVI